MKRAGVGLALVLVASLAGCANMSNEEQRMLSGGGIGAAGGAVLGALTGGLGVGTGAAIGGALGVAAGYVLDKTADN